MCNAVMNMHEGCNLLQKPANIKASASLIIHIWSKKRNDEKEEREERTQSGRGGDKETQFSPGSTHQHGLWRKQ